MKRLLLFGSRFFIISINAITIVNDTPQERQIVCWYKLEGSNHFSLDAGEKIDRENITRLEVEKIQSGQESKWIEEKVNRQAKILRIQTILDNASK